MNFMRNKQGFGLMEVVIAAVVLGFMLIGLNTLQKGNREGILRVRARDAANSIAQSTIDSLSALGSAMVKVPDTYILNPSPFRFFDGGAGEVKIDYTVVVNVTNTSIQAVDNSTAYTRDNSVNLMLDEKLAKNIDVTVSWKFKNSDQSINVSTVIR